MLSNLIGDLAKLTLAIACIYFIGGAYVSRCRPQWSRALKQRRISKLLLLILATIAVKLTEDVQGGESGPLDRSILLFIHAHVPGALTGWFEALTVSGSGAVQIALTVAVTLALLFLGHRREALLMAASVGGGALLVLLVKTLSARERPELWNAAWYWGSSFPSGHTLVVAAFATAAVLSLRRVAPTARWQAPVSALAVSWIVLVAASRLVLGVHWPTDVVVAACLGACVPLAINMALDLSRIGRHTRP